ncbi:MAG: YezD family protein [Nitrospirae bacterium]|nr:YezD family protein [Candidatus Manganitrophaceae bacterium]
MDRKRAAGEDGEIDREILLAVRNIRYGSVEIVIHDSKVVQIERKEKVRFDPVGKSERSDRQGAF